MKKVALFVLTMIFAVGCYDDSALWDEIRDHEGRIKELEKVCAQMNTNISSIQTIVSALQQNDYVTNVAPIKQNGKEIGYTISFSKSGSITIYHGTDGKDGANGTNGTNGKDGSTPVIGTRQDTDGIYYWTLNGEWLRNDAGEKIPTTGKDGANGSDGTNGTNGTNGADGSDGVTPQLKIQEGYWYVSYDNGTSWSQLGKAVGENGTNGKDGADGDSFFKSVTQDENNVYITLADGTELVLPMAQVSQLTLDIDKIGDDYVIFKGKAKKKSVDLKVTVYYGQNKKLTVYNCEGQTSITEFFDLSSFTLVIDGLKPDSEYYYFTEVVYNGTTKFSDIESFCTNDGYEYIDEYGVNHGKGVEIDGVVWAPVNCGYHATDYKYGKLYQWGRKYGQGYNDTDTGAYSDAVSATKEEAPVSVIAGNNASYSNIFYTRSGDDWLYPHNGALWNSGTEESPVKTEYDPCPDGWRVPTKSEYDKLLSNHSEWVESGNIQGYWFTGSQEYSSEKPQIFLPAAGYNGSTGPSQSRGSFGRYWSSTQNLENHYSYRLEFNSSRISTRHVYRSQGESVRCVKDNGYLIPVIKVSVNKESLVLSKGESASLSASVYPLDANHQDVLWYSSDELIATVTQDGVVTMVSEGAAKIYAVAGLRKASCTVTVKQDKEPVAGDYVDEYSINHGQGVNIDGTVWAPVNCGYHKEHYKYGKLYQWGRKYGQGYYVGYDEIYNDAKAPRLVDAVENPDGYKGRNGDYADAFLMGHSRYEWNWVFPHDNYLWNSGTDLKPVKRVSDPCPEGWRVPTKSELKNLFKNYSTWTKHNKQYGYWFSGSVTYSSSVSRIFLPAAGYHHCESEEAGSRSTGGYYWSSKVYGTYCEAECMDFSERNIYDGANLRANGMSVRCVQE